MAKMTPRTLSGFMECWPQRKLRFLLGPRDWTQIVRSEFGRFQGFSLREKPLDAAPAANSGQQPISHEKGVFDDG